MSRGNRARFLKHLEVGANQLLCTVYLDRTGITTSKRAHFLKHNPDFAYWPKEIFDYVNGVSDYAKFNTNGITARTNKENIAVGSDDLKFCKPIKSIDNYWHLVELVSLLSAANPGMTLYFRGQSHDFHLGNDIGHQLLPSLWRRKNENEFEKACKTLLRKDSELVNTYKVSPDSDPKVIAVMEKTPLARWALLQHYNVCDTPLLDLTKSLQVACAFAKSDDQIGYIYILGLPYLTQSISIDMDNGITSMFLLGVTPHNAKRPLLQNGYLACDENWWKIYSDIEKYSGKRDVDFSNRLLAVFKVSFGENFWDSAPSALSLDRILPENDAFLEFLYQNDIKQKNAW